jgi:hypothetical protein
MPRPTKAKADDAIVRFYGALLQLGMDDSDVPDVQIMVPVADVRAIVRDRNALEKEQEDE